MSLGRVKKNLGFLLGGFILMLVVSNVYYELNKTQRLNQYVYLP